MTTAKGFHHYESFNAAYLDMIAMVHDHGDIVTPRPGSSIGQTKEVLGAGFSIPSTNPLCTLEHRKMSYAFCMLEPIYLFTHQWETDIATPLMEYAPNLRQLAFNEHTQKFDGNYGDRIHLQGPVRTTASAHDGHIKMAKSQLVRAYHVLKHDPESRRAVVTIHNPVWDLIDGSSKDIPCTLNLHFMIRDEQLICFCTMRSNDLWYGTPHNVMMFTFLQRTLAAWLGVPPGTYHHRANSLHLYEKHWELGKAMYKDPTLLPRTSEILYPHFAEPEAMEQRMHQLMKWERDARTSGGVSVMSDFQPMKGYEEDLVAEVEAFWARKAVTK